MDVSADLSAPERDGWARTVTAAGVAVVDLAATSLRELNSRLHELRGDDPDPRRFRVENPNGAHAVACGLDAPLEVEIAGHVGYYCAGRNKRATVVVHGNAGPGVVDVEVVELPRRPVSPELPGVGVDSGPFEEAAQLRRVLLKELLLDAVGAQRRDASANIEVGLVDRVAERLARVAADDQRAALRHERSHVPDRAAHHDLDPLHRDAAA